MLYYKDKGKAQLFALLLGGIGAHRFYMGQYISGIMYALFCWTLIPMFLGFVEIFSYMTYSKAKWDDTFNKEFFEQQKIKKLSFEALQRIAKSLDKAG